MSGLSHLVVAGVDDFGDVRADRRDTAETDG